MTPITPVSSINLSPPDPALDARHLDDLIQLWLDALYTRRARHTVDGYAFKITHFRRWWADVGPGKRWQLRRRDIEEFARYLEEEPLTRTGEQLAYNSRFDILRRLRQMFRWAHTEGYVDMDYTTWVVSPEGEPPRRKVAPLTALLRLFTATVDSPFPGRDRAIIAMLIGTGIRRAECANLRVEDVQIHADNSGLAAVRGKRTRANQSGLREVAFDAATGGFLRAYLDVYGFTQGALFRSGAGRALTPQGIYKAVKRCVKLAGLEEQIQGCHDLRRAFATHFARSHKGETYADLLRRQLGHTTYRMTSEYTLFEADDMRNGFESPLSQLLGIEKNK